MATLDAIVKFGANNPINGTKYAPGHAVRKGMEFQEEARKKASDFRLRLLAVNNDTGLTEEGKRRERIKIAKASLEELGPINKMLEYIRRERDGIATKLNKGEGKQLTLEDLTREREYRDIIRGMESGERQRLFEQAIERGDDLTLNAFFNAPWFKPLLNDRIAAEGKRMLMERRNPEAAAELADLEFAHTALSENLNDIATGIKNDAGIVEERRPPDSAA